MYSFDYLLESLYTEGIETHKNVYYVYCDTGNAGPGRDLSAVYTDDPQWDGQGCGPISTCCDLNNPPWFCTTLPHPHPITDAIELRICSDQGVADEDVIINFVDISII